MKPKSERRGYRYSVQFNRIENNDVAAWAEEERTSIAALVRKFTFMGMKEYLAQRMARTELTKLQAEVYAANLMQQRGTR
jgi:hypothetical protein